MPTNIAVTTVGLTKRYGRTTALRDCTIEVPAGRVVGLVGPNGAGKSTLLRLCCGLARPTAGTVTVLGGRPGAQLGKVGFVAQQTPVYAGLTVGEHLRMGERLNPGWDGELARRRTVRAGLDPRARAGGLSGGQRAQLALTIAAAKRPELLILDEPAAALDPLARDDFIGDLLSAVGELGATAILSSHLLGDVARACDHLIVLAEARVALAGGVRELLEEHRWVTGPRGRRVARGAGGDPVSVEDLALAYLGGAR
ncbi:ABC transporter ATP-binding protein [Actinoplanes sp. NPDC051411]|uniref:ABC transporter ATP-binding protein n=1 Tax=Actinoplanes sp. NPDC051411 TaxID=3155522 RepID=UPI00342943BA